MSPRTNSTANMCVTPILCVPILPISYVHVVLHVCALFMYSEYVPIIGFSSEGVSACVQISVCNYSDSKGNCPSSPTTKRILILSGLTVPPNERGRGWQSAFHGGQLECGIL